VTATETSARAATRSVEATLSAYSVPIFLIAPKADKNRDLINRVSKRYSMSRTLVDSEQRIAIVQASIVLVIEIGLVRRATIQRKREREWEISSEYIQGS